MQFSPPIFHFLSLRPRWCPDLTRFLSPYFSGITGFTFTQCYSRIVFLFDILTVGLYTSLDSRAKIKRFLTECYLAVPESAVPAAPVFRQFQSLSAVSSYPSISKLCKFFFLRAVTSLFVSGRGKTFCRPRNPHNCSLGRTDDPPPPHHDCHNTLNKTRFVLSARQ